VADPGHGPPVPGRGLPERRRFLDRLVFALDPAHAKRAARSSGPFARALAAIARWMRDPVWLDGLEGKHGNKLGEIRAHRGCCAVQMQRAARGRVQIAGQQARADFPRAVGRQIVGGHRPQAVREGILPGPHLFGPTSVSAGALR